MENLLGLPALGLRSRWSRPPSTTPEMLNLCSNGIRGSTLLLRPRAVVRPHSASTASITSDLSEGYLVNNLALSRGAASTPTTLTQVLQERNLLRRNQSIYTYMKRSESRFLDAYVLPFKDELPELYEAYTGKKLPELILLYRKISNSSLQDSCVSSRRAS